MNLLKSFFDKKYKNKWRYACLVLFYAISQFSFAGNNLTLSYPGNLIYDGPADQIKVGEPIGTTWIATGSRLDMCDRYPNQDIATAYISPVSPASGLATTIDGVRYVVFDTGTPGIGWVMSIKDRNANQFSALLNRENRWYPDTGTDNSERVTIGGDVKVTFIKTESRLVTGITTIQAQTLARIYCYNRNSGLVDSASILTPAKQIRVTARGCTVSSPKNDIVQMGNFNSYNLPAVGSTAGNQTYNILLSCDPSIKLSGTISDQSRLSNRSQNVSLSSDSTADGVAVQVSYKGKVVSLGPDASAVGTINQFDITNTGNGGTINFPLTFNYIRTGTLQAGSANALVGVTLSYQ